MNYPTETEHEAMGQRRRTEDHWKVIFASFFIFYLFIYFIIIIIIIIIDIIIIICRHTFHM